MNVRELITRLEKHPDDCEVWFEEYDGNLVSIGVVKKAKEEDHDRYGMRRIRRIVILES